MRFKCSTCNGVFFLETTKPIPCPACMSMLEVAEEAETSAAGPAETQVVGPAATQVVGPAETQAVAPGQVPVGASSEGAATTDDDGDLNFDAMLAALNEPAEQISLGPDTDTDDTITLPSDLFAQLDSSETSVDIGATQEVSAAPPPDDDTVGSEGVTQEISAADLMLPEAFAAGIEAALRAAPGQDETATDIPSLAAGSSDESATVTLPRIAPPPVLAGQGGTATVTLPRPSQQPTMGPGSTQTLPPPPSPTQSGGFPKLPESMDDLAFFNSETVEIKRPPGAKTGSWPVPPRPSSRRFATSPGVTQSVRPPTTSWATAKISGRMPSTRATSPIIRIPHYRQSGVQAWHLWVAGGVGATLLAVTIFSYYLRTQSMQKSDMVADSTINTTQLQPNDSTSTYAGEYSSETSAAIAEANKALEAALAAIEAEPDLTFDAHVAILPEDATLDLPDDPRPVDPDAVDLASLDATPGDAPADLASLDAPIDPEATDTQLPEGVDRPDGDLAHAVTEEKTLPVDGTGPDAIAIVEHAPDLAADQQEETAAAYRDRMVAGFATEAITEIEPRRLDSATLFELASGRHQVDMNVSPDGSLVITAKRPSAHVLVEGTKGNSADIYLKAGESISVRPAASVVVATLDGRLMLNVTTTNWSFVVGADDVRRNGLPVLCDDMACILKPGDELTTERLFSKVTFAVSDGAGHPKLVKLLVDLSQDKAKPGKVAMNSGPKRSKRISRGVFEDRSKDFGWQSVPLPTLGRQ